MASVYDYYLFVEALMKGNLEVPVIQQMTNGKIHIHLSQKWNMIRIVSNETKYGLKSDTMEMQWVQLLMYIISPIHDITLYSTNIGTFSTQIYHWNI